MAVNQAIVHTESENTSSSKYVKKRAIHVKIKCKIERFEALMDSTGPDEDLRSMAVSSPLAPLAAWELQVFPNDDDNSNTSVYLNLMTKGQMLRIKIDLLATYHLYLLDGTGGEIDSIGCGTHVFYDDESGKADVDFFAPDDTSKRGGEGGWPTRFSGLYGDAATSDCTIQIPAHKSFLMACSPAFRAMFSNPSAESKSGVIEISDFRPEPVRVMIRYCYEGYINAERMDEERVKEVFKLADKYLIEDLKAELEEHFIDEQLNVGNVVAMAVLADTYSAKKLKEGCTKLISREPNTIFDSDEWKELEKADPKLTIELLVAACRKK